MRRLMRKVTRRFVGQPRERGAVAVIVGLLLVALFGFAAIAVDLGANWSDRRQLQNGADAGALAVALDCSEGACGDYDATAQALALANKNDGDVTGVTVDLDTDAGEVTVTVTTLREHWFAPVLGNSASTVTASATAIFQPLTGGGSLPLAFSLCELEARGDVTYTDGYFDVAGDYSTEPTTIYLSKTTETAAPNPNGSVTSCYPEPDGNWLSGGFGWLDTNGTDCEAVTDADGNASSDVGNQPPQECSPSYLSGLVGQTITIPIFNQTTGLNGQGTWATYHILGYVGFELQAYYFAGQYKYGDPNFPCAGNERCIKGVFKEHTEVTGEYGGEPSDLGVNVVRLVE